jgi:hypothetical protein
VDAAVGPADRDERASPVLTSPTANLRREVATDFLGEIVWDELA